MAKSSKDAYGASGQTNLLMFVPESLHLITDISHPLYDERIHLPLEESMVLNIMEYGVLQPIMVWKDPETGLTCVVAGRQRVRHTLEANIRLLAEGKEPLQVPGVVKRGSAVRMSGYANANTQRGHDGFWRDADWLLCRDGKWRPVEPGSFPLVNGATQRVGRLRAYGNAINAEGRASDG